MPIRDGRLTKSERMARIRKKNTKPELLLRRALWSQGLRYRVHTPLPGTPDVVFPRAQVVVMVDGCFWHRCPEHFRMPPGNQVYWKSKIERNVERDLRITRRLEGQGWAVLRFWEHEVLDNLPVVVEEIRAAVEIGRGSSRRSNR